MIQSVHQTLSQAAQSRKNGGPISPSDRRSLAVSVVSFRGAAIRQLPSKGLRELDLRHQLPVNDPQHFLQLRVKRSEMRSITKVM